MQAVKKYRWSRDYESAEEELHTFFAAKNITAEPWELEPFVAAESKILDHDTRLWCAEGSIGYIVDGKKYSIQPGDTLEIPASIAHEAIAGIAGCTMYESPVNPV